MPFARVSISWLRVEQLPGYFELISDLIPTCRNQTGQNLLHIKTFIDDVQNPFADAVF